MKPSAGTPNKHGVRRDRRSCSPHDTPVLYAPDGRKVREGQRLSMTICQSSLHERFTIGKFLQPGPYTVPNAPRLTTNMSQTIEESQEAALILYQAITLASSTKMHRRYHPVSACEETSGLPYWRAPTPPMRTQSSPRAPPPNPLHRRTLGAAK